MRSSLFPDETPEPRYAPALAFGLAVGAHAALLCGAWTLPDAREPPPRATEIELAPAPEPPPPPAPEPVPAEKELAPARPAPRVAHAARILASRSDARQEPGAGAVDFVTDPEGRSYGSGVVARGGTAERAATPAAVAPRAAGVADGAPDRSQPARLQERDPCAGSYPRDASVDEGLATMSLLVDPSGQVSSVSIVSEAPAGEGFGRAARECLARKTLAPARDKGGNAVAAKVAIRVRFRR